ncbi:DUF2127 domain-containing protein [Saccharopolyspora sp. MS10]|uniref:DUF2127 domain-containing protein n=1 Tax=Saccharopolyspora sp. MS10 TaxID=3385973 RepID=UPI0039A2EF23
MTRRRTWTDRLFRAAIALKGLDGAGQLLAGIVLAWLPPAAVTRLAHAVVTRDLLGSPSGALAARFDLASQHFAHGATRTFAIAYLLVHGVIKLALVVALWREVVPLYPVAIVALLALVVVELLRAAESSSVLLVLFAALDVTIIVLVCREYVALRARRRSSP